MVTGLTRGRRCWRSIWKRSPPNSAYLPFGTRHSHSGSGILRCLRDADDVNMSAEVRKASRRADQQTFHGMIVPRAWIRGVFWDRVDVDRDQITLRPWLRRRRIV